MTNVQQAELNKALDRLAKSGLKAIPGTDRRNGKKVYGVLNRTATAAAGYPVYHMVRRNEDGKFVCDCQYGKAEGKVCVHKAAAFVFERDAIRAGAEKFIAARAALEERMTEDDWNRDAALPVQGPQGVRTLR